LRDRIRAQAAAEHRTFSGTVLHLVRSALDHDRDGGDREEVDLDEIERLHALYRDTISRKR